LEENKLAIHNVMPLRSSASRSLQLLQQLVHLPLHRLSTSERRSVWFYTNTETRQPNTKANTNNRHHPYLNFALHFELVPRIQTLGCLRIANVNALLGAGLHNQLRDVILLVKQKLRGGVRDDIVDGRTVG
jgi:hypothetical protein